ncbi:MAG: hypothetical protein ACXWQ5_07500 [Ktedonobacterales bacterium]
MPNNINSFVAICGWMNDSPGVVSLICHTRRRHGRSSPFLYHASSLEAYHEKTSAGFPALVLY